MSAGYSAKIGCMCVFFLEKSCKMLHLVVSAARIDSCFAHIVTFSRLLIQACDIKLPQPGVIRCSWLEKQCVACLFLKQAVIVAWSLGLQHALCFGRQTFSENVTECTWKGTCCTQPSQSPKKQEKPLKVDVAQLDLRAVGMFLLSVNFVSV